MVRPTKAQFPDAGAARKRFLREGDPFFKGQSVRFQKQTELSTKLHICSGIPAPTLRDFHIRPLDLGAARNISALLAGAVIRRADSGLDRRTTTTAASHLLEIDVVAQGIKTISGGVKKRGTVSLMR